jgi:hypothetical protein
MKIWVCIALLIASQTALAESTIQVDSSPNRAVTLDYSWIAAACSQRDEAACLWPSDTQLDAAAQAWVSHVFKYTVTSVGRSLVRVLDSPAYEYQFTFTTKEAGICDAYVDRGVTRISAICRWTSTSRPQP